MKISTLIFSIKQGSRSLYRNKAFSLASIGTIVACLFLFGIFYFVIRNVEHIAKGVEKSVEVTVFFDDNTTKEEKKEIKKQIAKRPEVYSITYISEEEAWDSFKEQNYKGEEESLDEVFGDDNPLKGGDSYGIKLNDVTKQTELVNFLEGMDGIKKVNCDEAFAEKLGEFNKVLEYVAIAIMILLLGVSVFLISITVLNGITVRSEEIRIMKLIGATDGFVRGPFIVEGMIIGIIGAIIPIIILLPTYGKIFNYALNQFGFILKGGSELVPAHDIFQVLIPVSICMGMGIGVLGTWITLFRKLRTVA